MPDKKLTDNEIVKALECCIEDDCDNCPYDEQTACKECLLQDAVNEINSLQIENETVKALNGRLVVLADRFRSELKTAKAEAYKEFADKIHTEIHQALESNYKARSERIAKVEIGSVDEFISYCEGKIAALRGIDDFVDETNKEMVGEDNDG